MYSKMAPQYFLETIGIPTVPWHVWHDSFEKYLSVTGLSAENDAIKLSLLKKYLGQEGRQVFLHLAAGPSYNDAVKTLSGYFKTQSYDFEEDRREAPENLTSSSAPGICQLVCGCLYRAQAILMCCSCCQTGNQDPIQGPEKHSVEETLQSSVRPWCHGTYRSHRFT